MAKYNNNPVFETKVIEEKIFSSYAKEIVKMFSDGFSTQEIAIEKNVSGRTLEKHIADIKAELGAKSIAHLVATFIRNKVIE
jgi:DNA-binding CsgD family transcriptional regulator